MHGLETIKRMNNEAEKRERAKDLRKFELYHAQFLTALRRSAGKRTVVVVK